MDKAGSEKSIIALEGWLQTPAGVYLREWEQTCLDNLTADIFGYNAVQIGMPQIDALAASRMPYKLLADRKVRAGLGRRCRAAAGVADAGLHRTPVRLAIDRLWWCCRMCWSFPPIRTRCCAKSSGC